MSVERLQELGPTERDTLDRLKPEMPSVSPELPDVVGPIPALMESVRAEVEGKLKTRKGRCEFFL